MKRKAAEKGDGSEKKSRVGDEPALVKNGDEKQIHSIAVRLFLQDQTEKMTRYIHTALIERANHLAANAKLIGLPIWYSCVPISLETPDKHAEKPHLALCEAIHAPASTPVPCPKGVSLMHWLPQARAHQMKCVHKRHAVHELWRAHASRLHGAPGCLLPKCCEALNVGMIVARTINDILGAAKSAAGWLHDVSCEALRQAITHWHQEGLFKPFDALISCSRDAWNPFYWECPACSDVLRLSESMGEFFVLLREPEKIATRWDTLMDLCQRCVAFHPLFQEPTFVVHPPRDEKTEVVREFRSAVAKGDIGVVKECLQGGIIDISCDCDWKENALHIAVQGGHPAMVEFVLEQMTKRDDVKSLLNAQNNGRQSPVQLAVLDERPEILELLLKKKELIDLECLDDRKRSPLYLAMEAQKPILVQMLLAAGARHICGAGKTITLERSREYESQEITALWEKRCQGMWGEEFGLSVA